MMGRLAGYWLRYLVYFHGYWVLFTVGFRFFGLLVCGDFGG